MSPRHPGGRTALLVVDMQNSYFDFPELEEQREPVTAKVNELVRAARAGDNPILLVRTQHERDRSTWTVSMHDDDQGFAFPGTEQAEYVAGLDTEDGVGLVKTRDSAFFNTDLAARLRNLGAERVVVCGVSTHSCVAQTAIDAFAHDFRGAVAREAVASENAELSRALLAFLEDELRQELLDQEEAVARLRGGSA
ncbi:cysteine hydrolase [Kocuria flava]|uniref:Cysteine hydrolase n=1 Tax=Kocuria flava TaxID=446860 RepID=A0A0U3HD09_9MICC|nr:isochorismatase family cysteine hydrolase [Kocuria flava]ALU38664.1 cysteine hydrolase [Kocuria flava]MCJ8504228.1 cysteine hydrolase [Kocuria flava]GEO91217.1 nicotinamidase [Kocuria flava]